MLNVIVSGRTVWSVDLVWLGLVWFYGTSIWSLLLPNPLFIQKTVLFQRIRFSMSTQVKCQKRFYFKQFSLAQKVLFQAIQFSLSTEFKCKNCSISNRLTVSKKWAQARLKIFSTKCVKNHILLDIYVKTGFVIRLPIRVNVPQTRPNQTKMFNNYCFLAWGWCSM